MSGAAGSVVPSAPAAAPTSASGSAPASAATAAAEGAGNLLPIDFAALLLGAVLPAAGDAAGNTDTSSDINELNDLPEKEQEDAASAVDLLFALLTPVQSLPAPKRGAGDAGSEPTPDGDGTARGADLRGLLPGLPFGTDDSRTTALQPDAQVLAPLPHARTLPSVAPPSLPALPLADAATLAAASALQLAASARGDAGLNLDGATALDLAAGTATQPIAATPASSAPAQARETAAVAMPPELRSPVRAEADALADAASTTLRWQADQGIGRAEIRMSPKDLGKIDIDLRMEGKHLHVDFNAANADVRSALEDSLPKLRETLASHGLMLMQADVGGGQARGDRAQAAQVLAGRDMAAKDGDAAAEPAVVQRMRLGVLDEYA